MSGVANASVGQPSGHLMRKVTINPRCCTGRAKCKKVISLYDLKVSAEGKQTFFITKSEPGQANLSLSFDVGLGQKSKMVKLCDKGGPGSRKWNVSMVHRHQCRDTSAVFGSGKGKIAKLARTLHVKVVCEAPKAPPARAERKRGRTGVVRQRRAKPAPERGARPDPGCRVDRECPPGQVCGRDHQCHRRRR